MSYLCIIQKIKNYKLLTRQYFLLITMNLNIICNISKKDSNYISNYLKIALN